MMEKNASLTFPRLLWLKIIFDLNYTERYPESIENEYTKKLYSDLQKL